MGGLATKIEEVGVALVILAILVGQVAVPIFLNVSTSGMTTTQATIWGVILTLSFLGIGLASIGYMRSARKSR
jgi:protein-S-isoprenylcysteine O-methyltransferase Ste14